MGKCYIGYQDMASQDNGDAIRERHNRICERRGCTEADIVLFNVEEAGPAHKRLGLNTLYNLKWFTYKGWQAYMEHTGVFAACLTS